jgi:polyisoprenyl-phosphate glycosyltransferase
MNKIKLSLVIPCYNEEKNISLIIDKLKNHLNRKDLEFILVDNGSSDETKKEIQLYSKKYKSIRLVIVRENVGYGNGIYQGLKSAKGDYIGWTHADLQTDPKDVLKALDIIKRENYPENIYIKGKRYGRPLMDKLVNTLGMSLFETLILGKGLYDINAQPNIFHKSLLRLMRNPPKDFSFDLYAYYLAKENKYKIIRIPVLFPERIYGESKWNTGWKARIKFIKRTLSYSFVLRRLLKRN